MIQGNPMQRILKNRNLSVSWFSSFNEENEAEHIRLAGMTPNQRLKEFGILQKRVWGRQWTHSRMIKTAKVEHITWAWSCYDIYKRHVRFFASSWTTQGIVCAYRRICRKLLRLCKNYARHRYKIVFANSKRIHYLKNIQLNMISLKDLLDCKRCSDRAKDLADVDELEKMQFQQTKNPSSRKNRIAKLDK